MEQTILTFRWLILGSLICILFLHIHLNPSIPSSHIVKPKTSLVLKKTWEKTVLNNALLEKHFELHELPPSTSYSLLQALGSHEREIKKVTSVDFLRNHLREISAVRLFFDQDRSLLAELQENRWVTTLEHVPKIVRERMLSGNIEDSFWSSGKEAGLSSQQIVSFSEIFSCQLDFARQVRKGDQWKVFLEESFLGKSLQSSRILAAEYQRGPKTHTAFGFISKGNWGYFSLEGDSLRGRFLRNPLPYGRISSLFQKRRFHPILKIYRPHKGVDYAAPRGTPVMAVGDGIVTRLTRTPSEGNVVELKHGSIYGTAYKHLDRHAKNLRKGQKIKQGQTIGYVGNTGLAQGFHLHLEFYVHGRHEDPLGLRFPRAEGLTSQELSNFKVEAARLAKRLYS